MSQDTRAAGQLAPTNIAGPVPLAPGHKRLICPEIDTVYLYAKIVRAQYASVQMYADPNDAPVFARMSYVNKNDGWRGEVVLQTFAADEVEALQALISTLQDLYVPVPDTARLVWQYLRTPPEGAHWEQLPFGIRGEKPRPQRTKWRDNTGKRVHVYKETARRHADPDCMCVACEAVRALPQEEQDSEQ
jgi:hypothetical protein